MIRKFWKRCISGCLAAVMVLLLCPAVLPQPTQGAQQEVYRRTYSQGVQNIVKRATQMTSIQWTPVQDIIGWGYNITYKAGTTYTGVPYGQPVYASYVPWKTSLDGFLAAVNDPDSLMYTDYSTYNKRAPYYSLDCSGFVSWAWGIPSRKHSGNLIDAATEISVSSSLTLAEKLLLCEVGDSFCKPGVHAALISDITYDAEGNVNGLEISEAGSNADVNNACARKTRFGVDGRYNLEKLDSRYFSDGYKLYRCKTRDSAVYTHSCASPLEGDVCSKCGYGQEKFSIAATNMALGSSLTMFFYVNKSDVPGSDYYMEISVTDANGNKETSQIPSDYWLDFDGTMYQVAVNDLAAKEMTDQIRVTVYNGEGKAVSYTKVDSVRDYAVRLLNNPQMQAVYPVLVDMLDYGAAAQKFFNYGTDDLANSTLTDEQKAWGTQDFDLADYSNNRVAGQKYLGSTLSLESEIVLIFLFDEILSENYMTAEVTYTDHYGNAVRSTISEANFYYTPEGYIGIRVNTLVAADSCQLVTVKIYDGDELVASASDSMEGYVVRMSAGDDIYSAVLKFSRSAYEFFH